MNKQAKEVTKEARYQNCGNYDHHSTKPRAVACEGTVYRSIRAAVLATGNTKEKIASWAKKNAHGWGYPNTAEYQQDIKDSLTQIAKEAMEEAEKINIIKPKKGSKTEKCINRSMNIAADKEGEAANEVRIDLCLSDVGPEEYECVEFLNPEKAYWIQRGFGLKNIHKIAKCMMCLTNAKVSPREGLQFKSGTGAYVYESRLKVKSADENGSVIVGKRDTTIIKYDCIGERWIYMMYLPVEVLKRICLAIESYGGWEEYNRHANTRYIINNPDEKRISIVDIIKQLNEYKQLADVKQACVNELMAEVEKKNKEIEVLRSK